MRKKTIQKSKNPLTLRPIRPELFWDVDPKTIDTKKHARYIIERILDFGNDREVGWVWHRYRRQKKFFKNVIQHSRGLNPQSRSLWKLLLK